MAARGTASWLYRGTLGQKRRIYRGDTMPRHAIPIACLALFGFPALAQTPLPCRVGLFAKDGHLVAEAIEAVADGQAGRVEYRLRLRNPYPWPAAVLAGIAGPGVEQPPAAEPVVIPPREARLVPAGVGRGAGAEDWRAAISIPFCVVPASQPAALVSGHPAIPPRGVEVIRDEGAHQILQRF